MLDARLKIEVENGNIKLKVENGNKVQGTGKFRIEN
jgi:hypothetical protein